MHNILVSAYGCEPFVGSEAGVGWNWVLQMAKNNRLHVITRENNREKIEINLPVNLRKNIKFYYYDAPAYIRKLKRREKGLYLYYTIWQFNIIKIIRKIIETNDIDYTMHLSFGSFWMPTFLPFFKTPFIWGPLGGGDCVPKSFLNTLPLKDHLVQSFRYFLKKSAFINPLVAYPSKKAAAILVRTFDSAETIPDKYKDKVHIVLETAIEEEIFSLHNQCEKSDVTELIYTGRLIPIKNVMSLVKTVKLLPDCNIHLTLVGRGNEKDHLISFINENGLQKKVTILDEVPRTKVLELLSQADIYLFPSLHEGGSWALMEAMALGLPVICQDCTGMHTITNDQCAIRIKPHGSKKFVQDMAKAIQYLIDHPDIRRMMGENGRKRIWDNFRWKDKSIFIERILTVLDEVVMKE